MLEMLFDVHSLKYHRKYWAYFSRAFFDEIIGKATKLENFWVHISHLKVLCWAQISESYIRSLHFCQVLQTLWVAAITFLETCLQRFISTIISLILLHSFWNFIMVAFHTVLRSKRERRKGKSRSCFKERWQ